MGINAIAVGLARGYLQLHTVTQHSIITFAHSLQHERGGLVEGVGSPRDYTCVDVVLYEETRFWIGCRRKQESKRIESKIVEKRKDERVGFWTQGNYEKIRSGRVGQTYLVSGKEGITEREDQGRSNSGACERVLVFG